MNYERWKDIAEMIGLAAIVASLVFVGMELRQSERTARVALISTLRDSRSDVQVFIAEHADIWARGCMGEDLSPADQVRFASVYRVYQNTIVNNWFIGETLGQSGGESSSFVDSFAANRHRYPGFNTAADAYLQWAELGARVIGNAGPVKFANAVRKRVAELRELEPEPLMDVGRCGY